MRPIYNICETTKSAKAPVQSQKGLSNNNEEESSSSGAKCYLKSVRNLINIFEQRDKEKNRPFRPNLNKSKSKSYANLRQPISSVKDAVRRFEDHKQKSRIAIPELDTIKNTANSLKNKITSSKTINNKECITYQNQIIALLTKIGSLESNGNPLIKEEKQKCLKVVQSCNTALKNKTGEEETTMALGSFVKTLTKYEVNNNEPVSKVKILRGIFEAKKDNFSKSPQKEVVAASKPQLVDIYDEFTYTPYSEYLKRKNSEETTGLISMSQMQDTSKSCENIATHDYSGIKRLLNRLNDKRKETIHHRAKSLTDIKVNSDLITSSTEDVLTSCSVKSASTENIVTIDNNNQLKEEENGYEQEPEVKLVSVKPAEDAEIPAEILIHEKSDTPVFNGDIEETTSESDEDSESDDHKHSSGFYSFVGDETLDDSFHDASDQEVRSEASYVNNCYEPFNSSVKCKMANGIVNITLNGVQVE